MGGSAEQALSIPWKSEDRMFHYNRLIPKTTPSPVTFMAAPMYSTKISEVWSDTIGCSVLATETSSRCPSFLTLNPNIRFLIPVATLVVGIILPFFTALDHDRLLIFIYLYEITLFVSLIKSGGQESETGCRATWGQATEKKLLVSGR